MVIQKKLAVFSRIVIHVSSCEEILSSVAIRYKNYMAISHQ